MEPHEPMTKEEVAEHFRVNPSTVRRWRLCAPRQPRAPRARTSSRFESSDPQVIADHAEVDGQGARS